MAQATACFEDSGFLVSQNDPYKGGYITRLHGASTTVEALQVEMVQRVYMPENAPEGAPEQPGFAAATTRLRTVLTALVGAVVA